MVAVEPMWPLSTSRAAMRVLSLTRFVGTEHGPIGVQGKGVHMPSTRLPYTPEFRAEAVQLYRSSGRGLKQISTELGIAPESLRRWAQQLDVDAGRAPAHPEEREELGRLRREHRTLRTERATGPGSQRPFATAFAARAGDPWTGRAPAVATLWREETDSVDAVGPQRCRKTEREPVIARPVIVGELSMRGLALRNAGE